MSGWVVWWVVSLFSGLSKSLISLEMSVIHIYTFYLSGLVLLYTVVLIVIIFLS